MQRASLHARLRDATAEAHERLERDLDWEARVAARAGYRDLLAGFHGFHAAYEPAIGEALEDEAFFAPRRRLALLEADLRHLGLADPDLAALPRPARPRLEGPAAAMGALYVLEGSTLGGQVIGRRILALHGLDARGGCRYYLADGRRVGALWAAFRARLDETAALSPAGDGAVAAATRTFDALRAWLCAGEAEAPAEAREAGAAP
ncbi:biliverdin-producing heme oxygenase [Methylobacterium nigriterrae]|uniref:biliverdin-producing heme oxygenase n=1 Tax=Methylobacterium nigriterrae TaxID=3127512 RepID=UPI003013D90A